MIGKSKTEQDVAALQQRDRTSTDRYQDLQIAVYGPGGKVPILRVGGRWDTVDRCYVGPAESEAEIHLTRAQWAGWPALARWIAGYVAAHAAHRAGAGTLDECMSEQFPDPDDQLFTMMLYGGRQSGKTHLGAVVVVLVTVAIPGSVCPVVSTIKDKTAEIVKIIERFCLPASWRVTTQKEIRLINGSLIPLFSGRVSNVKALGPIHAGMINEAQEQPKQNWADLQGNALTTAGMVMLAMNPPRSARGAWTQELYDDIIAGRMPGADKAFIDPRLNQYSSTRAMGYLSRTMDERQRKRDIQGDMGVSIGDVALHAWSDSDHVLGWIPTTWVDVTSEVTRLAFGRSYEKVGGLDWDQGPGPSFCLGRIFRPRDAPEYAITLVIEHGQRFRGMPEEKFAPHLVTLTDHYGKKLARPESTIWVGDSSGRFESSYRRFDPSDQPSWERMRKVGWQVTFVDPKEKRNPRRVDRFELINTYVLDRQQVTNQPRVVMITPGAASVIEDSKRLPRRRGEAARWSEHRHLVDAWTYLAWRLFSEEFRAIEHGVPEPVARARERGPMG